MGGAEVLFRFPVDGDDFLVMPKEATSFPVDSQ